VAVIAELVSECTAEEIVADDSELGVSISEELLDDASPADNEGEVTAADREEDVVGWLAELNKSAGVEKLGSATLAEDECNDTVDRDTSVDDSTRLDECSSLGLALLVAATDVLV
jgi:hypothetical protein